MKEKIKQLIQYGFWGAVSTGINLALFWVFTRLGMPYIAANVISYTLAVIASYVFNNRFVFGKDREGSREGVKQVKYFAMRGISVAADSGLLALFHEVFGLELMVAKILVSVIIIGCTYIISKCWIFEKKQGD